MIKIYLAGPDVFRENALGYFKKLKKLCNKYGFEGVSPFDNEDNFDTKLFSKEHSTHVFNGNVFTIKDCQVVIANLIPFRGACIDDGTAWELGCGYAMGRLLYGYTHYYNETLPRVIEIFGTYLNIKQSEYPNIESFGNNCVNLMLQESIELSGGKILGSFEDCLIDLKSKFA